MPSTIVSFWSNDNTGAPRVKGFAGEGYLRLDVDGERGKVSLDACVDRGQRARKVNESLCSGSHAGQGRREARLERQGESQMAGELS